MVRPPHCARTRVSISSASVWTSDIEPPRPLGSVQLAAGAEPIGTARCPRCQRTLPLSSFHRQQSQCKDCRREYIRARGDLYRRQTSAARDKRRAVARRLVAELLLAGRCTDCGLADPLVLEFDHVGPKRAEVGLLVREGYRLSKIVEEIANCELVCANCHRRRTGLRARSWRIDPDWRAAGESRPLRKRNLQFIVDSSKAPLVWTAENAIRSCWTSIMSGQNGMTLCSLLTRSTRSPRSSVRSPSARSDVRTAIGAVRSSSRATFAIICCSPCSSIGRASAF